MSVVKSIFSSSERSIIKLERAMLDLKNGLPVAIKAGGEAILLYACEALSDLTLSMVKTIEAEITISLPASRANHLFTTSYERTVEVQLESLDIDTIKDLCFSSMAIENNYKIKEGGELSESITSLLKAAEILPCGLIVRLDKLDEFCRLNGICELDPHSIASYNNEIALELTEVCRTNLKLYNASKARIACFKPNYGGKEHYAIIIGDLSTNNEPVIRIHSACFTGDLLGSLSCDCGEQLQSSIEYMNKAGSGIIIYLKQEGRGIGLVNKLRAYELQQQGHDTVEANHILGYKDDEREFLPAFVILQKLGISKVKLLSNNPKKSSELEKYGIKVVEIIPHQAVITEHNNTYLRTKASKLGHQIDI